MSTVPVPGAPALAAVEIPAEVGLRLRGLRLRSRWRGAGRGDGVHSSQSRGTGLEFVQYRAYDPGDEPRRIDWKLYARSDRLYVRDATRDAPLTLWVILDASGSMVQTDTAAPAWRKLDAAKRLAACLAELALAQGDAFGWLALGGAAAAASGLPAATGRRHRDRFRLALAALDASGRLPSEPALRALTARIEPGALVVLVSDFFDAAAVALAERLAASRCEVCTVQLLGADELSFPFSGGRHFRDPEGPAERRVDAGAVRESYLAGFASARRALTGRLAAAGVRHVEQRLDAPVDRSLRTLFAADGAGAAPGFARG